MKVYLNTRRKKTYTPRIYFSPKDNEPPRWIRFVEIGGFLVLTAVLVYIVFFSGIFNIKKVNIVNAEQVDIQRLEQKIKEKLSEKKGVFPKNQILFFINTEEIREHILDNFLEVKEVSLEKHFPDILKIVLTERESKILFQNKKGYFLIDKTGLAYKKIAYSDMINTRGRKPIILKSEASEEDVLGEKGFSSKIINIISEIQKTLPERTGVGISYFEFPNLSAQEIHVQTTEEWKILFDTGSSIENQMDNLKKVLTEKIKSKRTKLKYIDLRVGDRVYYK